MIIPMLPNNLELAERRLECSRKRFMKDNSLLEKYQVVMNKLLTDFTSRGVKFNINDVKVWEEGPHFLKKPKDCWPAADIQGPDPHLLELKKTMSSVDLLVNYYSDWTKLLKAVAWLTRFQRYLLIMRSGRTDLSLQVGMLRVDV
ncbi:unnamed protein product [Schistosoma margrebowiei]|uniref:Uncharacterized protein n=1 Tax=Schistosoma margrebowiei TaxID=48269 RepID=A0A183M482_9TREM|nr:unnamed protein product [Schistosoma margrebowiei]